MAARHLQPGPSLITALLKFLCKLLKGLLRKAWQLCTSSTLILLLIYWAHGNLFILTLVFGALFGLFYNFQDSLLYFPQQPESSTSYVTPPSAVGIPYENIYMKTKDGVNINAVLFKQSPLHCSRVPTILFFHGNAGNIGHRYVNANALYSTCGCNVMLLEYRGFGRSDGTPSESGMYVDAQAALDYLHTRSDIDHTKMFLMGRSLGGAVAIHLASKVENQDRIRGIVLENTFTNIPEMGAVVIGLDFLKWLPLIFYKNQYLSLLKIYKVQVPTLFLSGSMDELVPPNMMYRLFERCGSRVKKMIRFARGSHNETWQCDGYFPTIANFLSEVTRQESIPLQNSAIYGVQEELNV
ncbi:protein ABHD13-like [Anneissia japonica]|uniref:protein ABHD13-like n=1 Tax=Anneissia japonica TaxID=1529436 RepID=UPI0014257C5D|nr:protein ABHD13-like [Anneissia japonica]